MDDDRIVQNGADTIANEETDKLDNGWICNASGMNATLIPACRNGTDSVKWRVEGSPVQNLPSGSLSTDIRIRIRKLSETEMGSNENDLNDHSDPKSEYMSVSTYAGDIFMKAERKRPAESHFDCETKSKISKIEPEAENVGEGCLKLATMTLDHTGMEKAMNMIKKLKKKKAISTTTEKTDGKKLKGSMVKRIRNGNDRIPVKAARKRLLVGLAKPRKENMKQADETGVKKAKAKIFLKKSTADDDNNISKCPTKAKENVIKKTATSEKETHTVKPSQASRIGKKNTMDTEIALKKKPEKVIKKPEKAKRIVKTNGIRTASKELPEKPLKKKSEKVKEANGVEMASKKWQQNAGKLYKKSMMVGLKKKPARAENVIKNCARPEGSHAVKPSQGSRIGKKNKMDTEMALKKKPEKVINKVKTSLKKRREKVIAVTIAEAEKQAKKKLKTINKEDIGNEREDETGANNHSSRKVIVVKKRSSEAVRLVKKRILQSEMLKKKTCIVAEEVKKREKAENVGEAQVAKAKKVAKTENRARTKATEVDTTDDEVLSKMENVVKKKSTRAGQISKVKKKALESEKVVGKKVVEGATEVMRKEGKAKAVVKKKAIGSYSETQKETEKKILLKREKAERVRGVKRKATEMDEVMKKKAKRTDIKFRRSLSKKMKKVKKTNLAVLTQKKCRSLEVRLMAIQKLGRESSVKVETPFKQNQLELSKTKMNIIDKSQTEMEVRRNSKVYLVEDVIESGSLQRDDGNKNCLPRQKMEPGPALSEIKHVASNSSLLEWQNVFQNLERLKVTVFDSAVLKQMKIEPSESVLIKEVQEALIPDPSVTETGINVEDPVASESLKNFQRDMQENEKIGEVYSLLPTDKSRSACVNSGESLSVEYQLFDDTCGSIVRAVNSRLHESLIETEMEANPEASKHLSDKEVCAFVQHKTDKSKALCLNETAEYAEEPQRPGTVSNLVWHSSREIQINIGDINDSVKSAGAAALSAEDPSRCPITPIVPLSQNPKNLDGLAAILGVGVGSRPKNVLRPQKHRRLDDIAGKLWKMKLGAAVHADLPNKSGTIAGPRNQYDAVTSELNTVVDKSVRYASLLSEHSYARKQSTNGEAMKYETMQYAEVLGKPRDASDECRITESKCLTSKEYLNVDADSKRFTTVAAGYLNSFTTPTDIISSLPEDHLNSVLPSDDVRAVTEEHANAVVSFKNATDIPQMQFGATEHAPSFLGTSEKHLLAVTDLRSEAMSVEQVHAVTDFHNVTSTTEKHLKFITPGKNLTAMSENHLNDGLDSHNATAMSENHLNDSLHSHNATAMSEEQLDVILRSKHTADLHEEQLKAVTRFQSIKAVSEKQLNAASLSQSIAGLPELLNTAAHSRIVTELSDEALNVNPTHSVMVLPDEYLYGFTHPTRRLMVVPDEDYHSEQQASYDLLTPVDYFAALAPRPGFPVVLQGDGCKCSRKEVCWSIGQSQVGNNNMLRLQNDALLPGGFIYAVGNASLFQPQNDALKDVCQNVAQAGNNNLLQLQNDAVFPSSKVCYTVAPSQVEHSNDKVCYVVKSSVDKREMVKDENVNCLQAIEKVCYLGQFSEENREAVKDETVNHLQSQNDELLLEEVCYLGESSEENGGIVKNETVNHLQSQNDELLSEEVCYLGESSEENGGIVKNETVNHLQSQNDELLSEEVCYLGESSEENGGIVEDETVNHLQSQNDELLSEEVCYLGESSEEKGGIVKDETVNHFQAQDGESEEACCLGESFEEKREVVKDENVNHLQSQDNEFLSGEVYYMVESSEDEREMVEDEHVNHLQSQNDEFLSGEVYYMVESSEDEREMTEDENVNCLQSLNDALLSKEECYLVDSSEDEREMANDNVKLLPLQSGEFLPEELHCINSEFNNDLLMSQEDCYTFMPNHSTEVSNIKSGVSTQLQKNVMMPNKESDDATEASERHFEQSESAEDILNCDKDVILQSHNLTEGYAKTEPQTSSDNTDFSAVSGVGDFYGTMPQSTLNLPKITSTGAVEHKEDQTAVVSNCFDVQDAGCSTVLPYEVVFDMLDIGNCIEVESASIEIMPEYVVDDCAVALKKDGFIDEPSHSTLPRLSERKLLKRKCKSLSTAKENPKDVAQKIQRRSTLGLRVTPSKVKPFQFDHRGVVMKAGDSGEKPCEETSKDSRDILGKLLHNLVNSDKKTTNPKQHLVGQKKSDIAESSGNKPSPPVALRLGELVWARLSFQRFWPAVVVHPLSCGQSTTKPGYCWVFWFGDYKVSEVPLAKVLPFAENFSTMYVKSERKTYETGILEAVKELADRANSTECESVKTGKELIAWASSSSLSKISEGHKEWPLCLPSWVLERLEKIRLIQLELQDSDSEAEVCRKQDSNTVKGTHELFKDGQEIQSITDICIACRRVLIRLDGYVHPFFEGGLCPACRHFYSTPQEVYLEALPAQPQRCKSVLSSLLNKDALLLNNSHISRRSAFQVEGPTTKKEAMQQSIFFFDSDGTNSYCIICGFGKEVFVCEVVGCNKLGTGLLKYRQWLSFNYRQWMSFNRISLVYCSECIRRLAGESIVETVRKTDGWSCFLCTAYDPKKHGLLHGRREWRTNLALLFHDSEVDVFPSKAAEDRQPIRVLSLFDGIGTGKLVLDQLNIHIEKYFASEVEQDAITVAQIRHPRLIDHIGDVRNIGIRNLKELGPFDLLIGGSPCNELSVANPCRKGLEAGSGLLFFEFVRILMTLKSQNKDRPLFWIYENVASMNEESRSTISRMFACEPAVWDAQHFSAQRRARYFWGNIPGMYCPLQYSASEAGGSLDDHLFPTRKAKVQKIRTITTQRNSLLMDRNKDDSFPVTMGDADDSLWIPEVERIFGFPEHYTDVANLSASRRLKLLGQSWSVPVIRHLLSPLGNYFQTTSYAAAAETLPGSAGAGISGTDSTVSNAATASATNAATDSI